MNDSLKLHLGCADQILDGWVNVDASAEFKPDLVHDLNQPLPYEDQSADAVMAKDLLEHFDKYARFFVFYDWARVLKIDGTIELELPNFKKILKKQRKFTFENFADFIFGETMFRSSVYIGHFGNHKFGYSKETLRNFVSLFGIESVQMESEGLNIQFKGIKRKHVNLDTLRKIKVHSHANSFGDTPDLELGFIEQQIEKFRANN